MNNTYKTMWNPRRGEYVCVSEKQGISRGSKAKRHSIVSFGVAMVGLCVVLNSPTAVFATQVNSVTEQGLKLAVNEKQTQSMEPNNMVSRPEKTDVTGGDGIKHPGGSFNNQTVSGKTIHITADTTASNVNIVNSGKVIADGAFTQSDSKLIQSSDGTGHLEVKGTMRANNVNKIANLKAKELIIDDGGTVKVREATIERLVAGIDSTFHVGDGTQRSPAEFGEIVWKEGAELRFNNADLTIHSLDLQYGNPQRNYFYFVNYNSHIKIEGVEENLKYFTYSHVAGATLDMNGYWFDDSEIYIQKGGKLHLKNAGVRNTYYTEAGAELKVDFYDGMSSIGIRPGTIVDLGHIEISDQRGGDEVLLMQGGLLKTYVVDIFETPVVKVPTGADGIPLYPVPNGDNDIHVTLPDGTAAGGEVVDSIIGFKKELDPMFRFSRKTKGLILFQDEKITQNVVNDATRLMQQKAAEVGSQVVVNFSGQVVEAPAPGQQTTEVVFDDKMTNDMFGLNPGVQVILNSHTLEKGTKTSGILEVANSSSSASNGWIKESVGFKNVNGFDKVIIKDGKDFALVGESNSSYSKMIGTADVSGENSKFTIGSSLLAQGTGTVDAITASNGGEVVARGGSYKIGKIDAINNGKLNNEASHLTVTGTLKVEGSGSQVKNTGTLVAQTLDLKTNNGLINEGVYKTVGTTNITGGSTSMATDTFAFHNKAKAQAQFTGKTTIGSVHSGQTSALSSGSLERPTFMNEGTASFADLELLRGAELRNWNGGVISANSLTMDAFSSLTNTGTLTVSGQMILKGTVRNNGTINGQRVLLEANTNSSNTGTMNMGTLTLQEGSQFSTLKDAVISNLEMAEGSAFAVVGDASTATVRFDEPVNGLIKVDRGNLTVGYREIDKLKLAEEAPKVDEENSEKKGESVEGEAISEQAIVTLSEVEGVLPTRSTLVLEHGSFVLGDSGKLLVGTGLSEDDYRVGDAHFGADSDFVVNTSWGNSLVSNGQGNLSVEEGSKLTVKSQGWGTYQIADGFASADIDAWKNNIIVDAKDRDVQFVETEHGLNVTVGSNNILDKLPTLAISNIANAVIGDAERHNNLATGVDGFISRGTDDGVLAEAHQAEVINSAANVFGASGLMTHNVLLANNVTNAIVERSTFAQPMHAQMGGFTFWNNVLGQELKTSEFEFTGGESKFEGHNHGFILGADYQTRDQFRFGMAFGYQDGNTKSNGLVKTNTETEGFTVAGYLSKDFGILNLVGSVGYTKLDNEIKQNLNVLGTQSLDLDSEIITADATAELRLWTNGKTTIIPHTAFRSVTVKSSDSMSRLNGEEGFRFESDSIQQIQIPFGVKVSHVTNTKSGWAFGTTADLAATFVSGDLDQKVKVYGAGASDTVTSTFADEVSGTMSVNLMASRNNAQIGLGVGYTAGESTDGNVSLAVRAKLTF